MVRIKSNGIIFPGPETKGLTNNFRDEGFQLDNMIDQVKQSSIYKYAYQLFASSQDADYWLAQLNAILDGISMPNVGIGDALGFTNKYNDKVDVLYNEVITNIATLVQQFRQYYLSLPTTQVSQLQQAGINSGVTGQGVSSAQLSERNPSNQSYSIPSENSIETLGGLVGFALSTTSGVLSIMQHFQQISQFNKSYGLSLRAQELSERVQSYNESVAFTEFVERMAEQGYKVVSKDFAGVLDPNGPDRNWTNNSSTRTKALVSEYQELMAARKYGPALLSAIRKGEYGGTAITDYDSPLLVGSGVTGDPGDRMGALIHTDWIDLGDMQLELSILEAERTSQLSKLDIAEGNTAEDLERIARKSTIADSLYNAKKAEIFLKRLNKLVERRDKGDAVAAVELLNLMNDASWQESAVYLISELGYDLANLVEPGVHSKVRDSLKQDIVDMYRQLKSDE